MDGSFPSTPFGSPCSARAHGGPSAYFSHHQLWSFVFLFCLHHQWDFHQCPQPTASIITGISTSALSQQSRGFSPCRQRLCSWRRDGDASVVASFPFTISSVGTCFHDSRGVPSECLVSFLRKILPKFETNPLSVIHRTLPFSG